MARVFTLAEANQLIPWLEESLRRIRNRIEVARAKHRELELIRAVGKNGMGEWIMAVDHEEAERLLEEAVAELNDRIDAIHARGCQIKDLERGLIDFPARIGGQDVLLCWESGESEIRYYHDLHSGYAGRRPIEPEM